MPLKRGPRRSPHYWLTISDAAGIVGCHRNTVYNWLHRDGLPYERYGAGGYIRIKRTDLEDFVWREYGIRI
jgi:excisionase family DNA binding protein